MRLAAARCARWSRSRSCAVRRRARAARCGSPSRCAAAIARGRTRSSATASCRRRRTPARRCARASRRTPSRSSPTAASGSSSTRAGSGCPPARLPPLGAIRCPTLIVRGAESPLLSAEGAAAFAAEIPAAQVAVIEAAGHNLHLEQPRGVPGRRRALLSRLERGIAELARCGSASAQPRGVALVC